MSDQKKRASLDFGDDVPAPPKSVDPAAIKEASRAVGFRETPQQAQAPGQAPVMDAVALRTRRVRRKTGRTEQFATRLRADTLGKIYGYADKHEITLAETIERAVAALEQIDSC